MTTHPATEQTRRQAYLEWLYQQSGRTNRLYTGLFQQRLWQLLEADMEQALGPAPQP